MPSLESEFKNYFVQHQIPYEDHTSSLKLLDFSFGDPQAKTYFSFDVKEKRQHYTKQNWRQVDIPQKYLFILDDLAARKILVFAPNSGLVIRDNVHQNYYFFSVVDLYLMPKKRVNRVIKKRVEAQKGKWLIDLRNGRACGNLAEIFEAIASYLKERENIFLNTLECYGEYFGEEIGKGGITRKPGHWEIDVKGTR
ncbi:hypothetical protein L0Z72_00420 [candidate division KSB1 bacterium]|nr:hypothetical protein [candidate division KSB1 bacterium]